MPPTRGAGSVPKIAYKLAAVGAGAQTFDEEAEMAWLGYIGYPVTKQLNPTALPGANKLVLHGRKYLFEAVI